MAPSNLLSQITSRYGTPRIVTLPETDPDGDQSTAFEQLRQQLQGANPVLFADLAPGQLDRFFHLRLAQVLRREPPLPALSIVTLTDYLKSSRLAGGFADRFRSGWPFAACIFVTETPDHARLSAAIGLPVEDPGDVWTPLLSNAPANQKVALQVQRIWGRCGSTTGFENQVESLVRAGYLTIRLFAEPFLRRGATMHARLAEIIPENNENAGAHLDVLAVPEGPPLGLRPRDHGPYWAGLLAATAACRVRDAAVVEAMRRAEAVVANHLEGVGTALALAPRARLMLDVRDDRARSTADLMRHMGKGEAEIQTAEAAATRVQAALLAIPDICDHVSASEFERLGSQSQRAAIVRPRIYANKSPALMPPVYDVLVAGDEHIFNIEALRWFLTEVWHPHLVAEGISVAIAGRVGGHARDLANDAPLLSFLGFVEDLDALRSACRLTVVPDRHGTGTAVKTLAALAAGHALVSTTAGVRGLDPAVSGLLPVHDEPEAIAADILNLVRNPDRLTERRRVVLQALAALHRGPDHAALLATIPRPTPLVRREREARWAGLIAGAILPDPRPFHFEFGTPFPMSGSAWDHHILLDGWHGAEAWGRWTDGACASLRVSLTEPASLPLVLELHLTPSPVGAALAVYVDDATLTVVQPVPGPNMWDIPLDVIRGKTNFVVKLRVSDTVCPARSGRSTDTRILGVGVNSVRVLLSNV
jgi:hypothetical protein